MPNILLEAMTAGLPIASSNRGPMTEVLGEAGIYFNPENPDDICQSIRKLLRDPILRERKAIAAFELSKAYTWDRCAQETFNFISQIYAYSNN
jgi:glycosyltransferase involved in cell wall biosynthesis